ncbi:MAG: hypothetical protein KA140_06165 [Caldisericia bacterium]|nr:hypothetical protein [Caldisericia bacterium]
MKRWILLAMCAFMAFTLIPQSTGAIAEESFLLTANGGCGYNQLSWTAVTGADRYWIYRGTGPGLEEKQPLTDFPIKETSYKDETGIENGKQYCYYVTAVNTSAAEFMKSNEACATPKCFERDECKLELKFQIDNKNYWVNGVQKGPMEAAPIVKWERTLILIKYVTNEIKGTKLDWDGTNKTVIITTRDGHVIKLQIGNKDATVDGKKVQIDPNNPLVTPIIVNGRTLVPFRFVVENLGSTDPVKWFGETKTIILYFSNPDCDECDWVKGNIVSVSAITATLTAINGFKVEFKPCTGDAMTAVAVGDVKDTTGQYLISQYKGCVELCIVKNQIKQWKAYPNAVCCEGTTECKEVKGKIVKVSKVLLSSQTLWVLTFDACPIDNATIDFTLKELLKDPTGVSIDQYDGCAAICVDANKNVVSWRKIDTDQCCDTVECNWLLVRIQKVEQPPAGTVALPASVYTFVCKDGKEAADAVKYLADYSLADENKKIPIGRYTGCAKICVDAAGKIVKWYALPELKDCCNPATTNCEWWTVKITGFKAISDKIWAITLTLCKDGVTKETTVMVKSDLLDENKKHSILKYTGCAKVCVKDGEITKWIAYPDKKDCCPGTDECKTFKGKITKTKYIEDSKRWVVYFMQCGYEKEQEFYSTTDLLDSTGKYPISQYTGCAEVCIKERIVVKWTALPDQECCPETPCKPVKGYIKEVKYNEDGKRWVIQFKTCAGEGIEPYAATDILDSTGKYPISQYKGCAEICWKDRFIVSWKALPEGECCPETPCKTIKGKITKTIYNEKTKRWVVVFVPCNEEKGLELYSESDLLDSTGKYPISQYTGCAEICFTGRFISKWTALPDQECCPQADDCKWIKGRLQKTTYSENAKQWVVIFDDCPIDEGKKYISETDLLDDSGVFPISQYSGCAKLCIKDDKVVKWAAYPDVKDCCQEPPPEEEIVKDCVCFKVVEINCDNKVAIVADGDGKRWKLLFDSTDLCKDIKAGDCLKLCYFKKVKGAYIQLLADSQLIINGCDCSSTPETITLCVKILEVNCDKDIPQFTANVVGKDIIWTCFLPNRDLCEKLEEGTCWIITGFKSADNAIKIRTIKPDENCDCQPEEQDRCFCITVKTVESNCDAGKVYVEDKNGRKMLLMLPTNLLEYCEKIKPDTCWTVCGTPIANTDSAQVQFNVTKLEQEECPCGEPPTQTRCVCLKITSVLCEQNYATGTDSAGVTWNLTFSDQKLCSMLAVGSNFKVCGTIASVNPPTMKVETVDMIDGECPAQEPTCMCITLRSTECSAAQPKAYVVDTNGKTFTVYLKSAEACGKLEQGKCYRICGNFEQLATGETIFRSTSWENVPCPCGEPEEDCWCIQIKEVECSNSPRVIFVTDVSGTMYMLHAPDNELCKKLKAGSCYKVCGRKIADGNTSWITIKVTSIEDKDCPCSSTEPKTYTMEVKVSEVHCWVSPPTVVATEIKTGKKVQIQMGKDGLCDLLLVGKCFRITANIEPKESSGVISFTVVSVTSINCN